MRRLPVQSPIVTVPTTASTPEAAAVTCTSSQSGGTRLSASVARPTGLRRHPWPRPASASSPRTPVSRPPRRCRAHLAAVSTVHPRPRATPPCRRCSRRRPPRAHRGAGAFRPARDVGRARRGRRAAAPPRSLAGTTTPSSAARPALTTAPAAATEAARGSPAGAATQQSSRKSGSSCTATRGQRQRRPERGVHGVPGLRVVGDRVPPVHGDQHAARRTAARDCARTAAGRPASR